MPRRAKAGLRVRLCAAALALASLVPSAAPALAGSSPALAAAKVQQRPTIVLLVLDDVGFSDLGAFGSEIRTPNIDALAAAGLRYNRFDSKAICSPTRAALLTGRNNQIVGMEDLAAGKAPDPAASPAARGELPRNAETIAQALQAAGYSTLALGQVAPRAALR